MRKWKLLLTGPTAGIVLNPNHDDSAHPAHYERVEVVEATAFRARIAELEGWVKMAYFEGHADALFRFGAQIGWQNSEARRAIEPPADSEVDDDE